MSVGHLRSQPRTYVVTGGNTGIGKAIALALARQSHHVIIVSRDPVKGSTAAAELRVQSGNPAVECVVGDLGSVAMTQQLADTLLNQFPDLAGLINNAGVWMTKRVLTSDGLETSFMVNHLAPFILSRRLLPRLHMNRPARIVNVSAGLYALGQVDLRRTPYGHDFGRLRTYASTKLCNVLCMRVMAEQIAGTGVMVNAVHPGVIRTKLGDMPGLPGVLLRLVKRGWNTPDQGAAAPVWLATAPEVVETNGQFFDRFKPVPFAKPAQNLELAQQVWDWSSNFANQTLGDYPCL